MKEEGVQNKTESGDICAMVQIMDDSLITPSSPPTLLKGEGVGPSKNWVTFTLYVGKVKFHLLLQDSHPSLYSTKTLYHLYISDPFW